MAADLGVECDLTATLSKSMDPHMVLPLLDFAHQRGLFREQDMLQAKVDLVSKTSMIDYAIELYQQLHNTDEEPADMAQARDAVMVKIEETEAASASFVEFLSDQQRVNELQHKNLFNVDYLSDKHGFTLEDVEQLLQLAKFRFECGRYFDGVSTYLSQYRAIMKNQLGPEFEKKRFLAMWGKLASEILQANWQAALTDIQMLKDAIDHRPGHLTSQLELLQQRSWLLHWSLFVFFNLENGRELLIELFLSDEKYLNTIQTNCPHLLRYLTAAIITNRRDRKTLGQLVQILTQESYTYSDPLTEMVRLVFSDFDFRGGALALARCETLLDNDFFLSFVRDEFMAAARLFFAEQFCRVHQTVDIKSLSSTLNISDESAEEWFVSLVQTARIDAKIDSERNHVVMGNHLPTVYQNVIDKTKDLSSRTAQLVQHVESRFLESRYRTED